MTYQMTRTFLLFLLIVYAILGFLSRFSRGHELYPFFSWKLFDTVPNVRNEFLIKITSLGEKIISPPVYYLDRKEFISPFSSSASLVQRKINALVRAYRNKNAQDFEQGKRAIENSFTLPISYDVVETRFIPLEFLKNRSIIRETTLFSVTQ
ncbi:hypothetical protein HY947_00380 [Candidatus Gottesmanbacteria bacterium]|nr:hypothetical protein [Candidatus Gottesmanbacteria bacterium]